MRPLVNNSIKQSKLTFDFLPLINSGLSIVPISAKDNKPLLPVTNTKYTYYKIKKFLNTKKATNVQPGLVLQNHCVVKTALDVSMPETVCWQCKGYKYHIYINNNPISEGVVNNGRIISNGIIPLPPCDDGKWIRPPLTTPIIELPSVLCVDLIDDTTNPPLIPATSVAIKSPQWIIKNWLESNSFCLINNWVSHENRKVLSDDLVVSIISHLSQGKAFLTAQDFQPQRILILAAQENINTHWLPRLKNTNSKLENIYFQPLNLLNSQITLRQVIQYLVQWIEACKATCVLIDKHFSAILKRTDINKHLGPALKRIARQCNCAILMNDRKYTNRTFNWDYVWQYWTLDGYNNTIIRREYGINGVMPWSVSLIIFKKDDAYKIEYLINDIPMESRALELIGKMVNWLIESDGVLPIMETITKIRREGYSIDEIIEMQQVLNLKPVLINNGSWVINDRLKRVKSHTGPYKKSNVTNSVSTTEQSSDP
jgi:hypothetical protein